MLREDRQGWERAVGLWKVHSVRACSGFRVFVSFSALRMSTTYVELRHGFRVCRVSKELDIFRAHTVGQLCLWGRQYLSSFEDER